MPLRNTNGRFFQAAGTTSLWHKVPERHEYRAERS